MKKAIRYEIYLEGSLPEYCSDWFEGMDVSFDPDTQRTLIDNLADQAALFGVLNKIQSLNLILISVERLKND